MICRLFYMKFSVMDTLGHEIYTHTCLTLVWIPRRIRNYILIRLWMKAKLWWFYRLLLSNFMSNIFNRHVGSHCSFLMKWNILNVYKYALHKLKAHITIWIDFWVLMCWTPRICVHDENSFLVQKQLSVFFSWSTFIFCLHFSFIFNFFERVFQIPH